MNPGGNLNVSPEEVVASVFIEVSDGQIHAVVSNPAVVFPGTVEKKYLSHDCIWFQLLKAHCQSRENLLALIVS